MIPRLLPPVLHTARNTQPESDAVRSNAKQKQIATTIKLCPSLLFLLFSNGQTDLRRHFGTSFFSLLFSLTFALLHRHQEASPPDSRVSFPTIEIEWSPPHFND